MVDELVGKLLFGGLIVFGKCKELLWWVLIMVDADVFEWVVEFLIMLFCFDEG